MASEYDGKIVTLFIQEGNKPGQPIATFIPSSRNRYLVFMPKEAPVGKEVRVRLVDTGNLDRRQMTLFRAEPVPVEYTERWKDNGDGTASRVKIAKDWKLEEREVEVLEKRQLGKREGSPSIQSNLQVVWGSDLTTSVIEDRQVRLIPLEEEKVEGGQLVWRKVSERQESIPTAVTHPITKIELGYCQVNSNRLQVTYDPIWSVQATVSYRKPSSSYDSSYSLTATWTTMPKWWQQEWETRYSVCQCGRQRRDTQVADVYGKCELCRAEETCDRCGKKKVKIALVAGQKVCEICKPYAEAEQEIETSLSPEKRQEFGNLARLLRSGQALPQPAGEVVLKASLNHISSTHTKERLTSRWSGYPWYYFTDKGVYGSIFGPAALALLEHLPKANGNGLVEMIAWFPDDHTSTPYLLYYIKTQVLGEKANLPPINHIITLLNEGRIQLAVRLRGSEPYRLAAIEGLRRLEKEFGRGSEHAQAVDRILQAEEQDYEAAVRLVQEIEAKEAERNDPRAIRLAELRQQLADLQQEVEGLEMNQSYEAEDYSQAELAAAERATAEQGSREVAAGDLFEATFLEEVRQGQTQMVAGPFWDEPSGTWIKLVIDPFQGLQVTAGEVRLVRVRPKNSQQVELFTYRVDNPEGQNGRGGRKVLVHGFFCVPIRKPSDTEAEIAETKAKIAAIEAEINQLEADIAANPPKPKVKPTTEDAQSSPPSEDDFGDGAMAAAFRKAGVTE